MPIRWSETAPNYFYLIPGGFVSITITSKIPNSPRLFKQSLLYQVSDAPANLTASTTVALATDRTSYIEAGPLKGTADAAPYLSEVTDGTDILVVPAVLMSDFLSSQIINPQQTIQVSGVIYKKIALRFLNSKAVEGLIGPTTKAGLREYSSVSFTFPATVTGSIDGSRPPVQGALAINQYAGSPVSKQGTGLTRIQQDKPGRYLVRGCGITAEQALSDARVTTLLTNLKAGGNFFTGGTFSLIPVVDVLGDIWTVRATQSAGYVRVAAQKDLNPAIAPSAEGEA